jgi:hypothetical protein
MTMFKDRLSEAEEHSNEAEESIKEMINAFFDFAKNEPKAYNYIMAGHYSELPKMTTNFSKPKDVFVNAIKKRIAKGDFTKMDENLVAALVIGMITRSIPFFNMCQIILHLTERKTYTVPLMSRNLWHKICDNNNEIMSFQIYRLPI